MRSSVADLVTELIWFISALGRLPFANVVLPMIANRPENRGSLEELMAHL